VEPGSARRERGCGRAYGRPQWQCCSRSPPSPAAPAAPRRSLAPLPRAPSRPGCPSTRSAALDPAVYAQRVLRGINQKRAARDLPALRLDTCTDRLAESWGSYLAANLEFYHQDLTPFFKKCDARYAGETLARGAVTPQEMVRLWMASDGHRHILLSKYPNRIGLGAYLDSRGDWLVAADFTQL
jgi:uncharacterized protein YkwD